MAPYKATSACDQNFFHPSPLIDGLSKDLCHDSGALATSYGTHRPKIIIRFIEFIRVPHRGVNFGLRLIFDEVQAPAGVGFTRGINAMQSVRATTLIPRGFLAEDAVDVRDSTLIAIRPMSAASACPAVGRTVALAPAELVGLRSRGECGLVRRDS
jgi:hypothetical protein